MSNETERAAWRDKYVKPSAARPATTAGGVHHVALLCADVERTIAFYQDVLGFPCTQIFENRDYAGSTHLFFDIGNGNALAFFDFPGLDLTSYAEVLGGLHHLALSMGPDQYAAAKARLSAAGVSVHEVGGRSCYLSDPDGSRIELLCDPLGEMYGRAVV